MHVSKKEKKQVALVLLVVGILFFVLLIKEVSGGKNAIENGILRGNTKTEIYQETFVLEGDDGSRQDVDITVYPRTLSDKEQADYIAQAIAEFEQAYLGENLLAEQVYQDLFFPTLLCDELVRANYTTSHPQIIWEDGSVDVTGLTAKELEDGVLVSIQVTFVCQETVAEYNCSVRVVEPILTEEEKRQHIIVSEIAQAEEASRRQERFVLPQTIQGQNVKWHKKFGPEPFYVLFLGGIATIAVLQKTRQDERRERVKREQKLLREYPQMVAQLSLLLGAGMSLLMAWERMVNRYIAERNTKDAPGCFQQNYLEEMVCTYYQIKDGMGIRNALEDFSNRVSLAPYRRMVALLLQNMDKGNRELVSLLDEEANHALEQQRNQVRRQGEEAGTKLLLPMLLLFVMVLVIIMVPAMLSF